MSDERDERDDGQPPAEQLDPLPNPDPTLLPVELPAPLAPIPAAVARATAPAASLTNPYNPNHTPLCRCPSCCKKAKLARGETLSTPKREVKRGATPPKSKPAAPRPPIDTHARATLAATTRWDATRAARFDWEHEPLEAANLHLGDLRREIEIGARTIQQRTSTANQQYVQCSVCRKDIENGRWMMQKTIRDKATGLTEQVFLCSQLCISRYNPLSTDQPPDPKLGPTGLPRPELPQLSQRGAKGAN